MKFNKLSEGEFKRKLEDLIEETESFYNHWYADHRGFATIGFVTAVEFKKGSKSDVEIKELFKKVGKTIDDKTIQMAKALKANVHDKSGNFTITKKQGVDLMYLEINAKRESIKNGYLKFIQN